MNGFEKRREQKKEQILCALTDLITTRNFSEIGVREIAAHAGVSPASIYNFFGSKEELARQVIDKYMREMVQNMQQIDLDGLSFSQIVAMFEQMSDFKQEGFKNEALPNFNFNDPAFSRYVQEYAMQASYPLIEKAIQRGVAEGHIAHAVSVRAMQLFSDWMMSIMRDPKQREEMDEALRKDITHLFLYGIFGKKP